MIDSIPPVLACDVGNSRLHLAVICGETVHRVRTADIHAPETFAAALTETAGDVEDRKTIVACSVNPDALKALELVVRDTLGEDLLVVGRDLPLPIDTNLPEPQSVGTDRLCAAVAAFDRLGTGCVVADFGSAVTVDCVSDDGVFLGGAILPGLAMSARALAAETAQLPLVELTAPEGIFGKNTRQAILTGLIGGMCGAVRGLVESYASQLGHWPLAIATGGDAELLYSQAHFGELVQAVVPDLTLRGVAMAYYRSLLKS